MKILYIFKLITVAAFLFLLSHVCGEETEPAEPQISPEFKEYIKEVINNGLLEKYNELSALESQININKENKDLSRYFSDNVKLITVRSLQKPGDKQFLKTDINYGGYDTVAKSQLLYDKTNDEILRAKKLRGDKIYNGFADIVNAISQGFSQIITGNIHVVFQVVFEGIYSTYKTSSFSEQDREIISLYETFQRKYPDSPRLAGKEKMIAKYQKRRDIYITNQYIEKIEKLTENGNYDIAEKYLNKAHEIAEDNKKDNLEKLTLEISKGKSKEKRESFRSVDITSPTSDSNLSESDKQTYVELLNKALIRDYDNIAGSEVNLSSDKLEDESKILQSAAALKKDNFADAKTILEKAAGSSAGDSVKKRAQGHLDNPEFDHFKEYESMLSDRKYRTFIYCMTGYRSTEQSAKITISTLLGTPKSFAQVMGGFLLIETAMRVVLLPLFNPVTDQPQIDAACIAMKFEKDDKKTNTLAEYLYKRYKKRRQYEKALASLQKSDIYSSKKESDLRENWAEFEIEIADKVNLPENKLKHLRKAIDVAPDNSVNDDLRDEIAELEQVKDVLFWIDKKTLIQGKTDWIKQYMNLSPDLTDGWKINHEMDDKGIGFLSEKEIIYKDKKTKEYVRSEITLDEENMKRLEGIVLVVKKNKELEETIQSVYENRYLPVELQGSVGGEGASIFPTLQKR